MIGILFLNVFIVIGLITLLITVLIKSTLLTVRKDQASTKQKTADQISLYAWIVSSLM